MIRFFQPEQAGVYGSPLWTKFKNLDSWLQNESVAYIARSSGIGSVYCSFNQGSKLVEIAQLGAIIYDRLSEIYYLQYSIFGCLD